MSTGAVWWAANVSSAYLHAKIQSELIIHKVFAKNRIIRSDLLQNTGNLDM